MCIIIKGTRFITEIMFEDDYWIPAHTDMIDDAIRPPFRIQGFFFKIGTRLVSKRTHMDNVPNPRVEIIKSLGNSLHESTKDIHWINCKNTFDLFQIENGDGECLKETITRPKSDKQPKATNGPSIQRENQFAPKKKFGQW